MSPLYLLIVEVAAAPKWFHSPSLAAGQVLPGNCWEVVIVALLEVPQEAHL